MPLEVTEWSERRRAPRIPVDVEAELRLGARRPCPGVIHDLSFLGSLFVPNEGVEVQAGESGQLRFSMPTSMSWIEPNISVQRITSYPGGSGLGIGFAFSGLTPMEERAVAVGCMEWDSQRRREYLLAVRCFMESRNQDAPFMRFGRLVSGSRERVSLAFPATFPLPCSTRVGLKLGAISIGGMISQIFEDRLGVEVSVILSGWGRDFFLHEARRQSLGGGSEKSPTVSVN